MRPNLLLTVKGVGGRWIALQAEKSILSAVKIRCRACPRAKDVIAAVALDQVSL